MTTGSLNSNVAKSDKFIRMAKIISAIYYLSNADADNDIVKIGTTAATYHIRSLNMPDIVIITSIDIDYINDYLEYVAKAACTRLLPRDKA